jgi:flagellar motor switch protein FliN/FliY
MNHMSDGAISQDEIDALLSGVDIGGLGVSGGSSSKNTVASLDLSYIEKFSAETTATFASSLETMTGSEFQVNAPSVENVDRDAVLRKVPEMVVTVISDFSEGLIGDHLFLMAPEFAQKLTSLINKEENAELDDMALSVISEIVSQHTGTEITNLSKTGKLNGLACNPAESVHVPKAMVRFPPENFVLLSYPVSVEGDLFTLWEVISSEVASGMISALGGGSSTNSQPVMPDMNSVNNMMGGMDKNQGMGMMGGMAQPQMGMGNMGGMNMNQGMGMMGGMAQPQMGMQMGGGMPMGMNIPNVQSLQYPTLQQGMSGFEQGNIGLIMDVYMEMTVELGRTKKQIKEILGMGEGTIIELDKLAGEPVDILVNHKPIAKGEVVVIDENFGVRVTEILSPIERVSDLH